MVRFGLITMSFAVMGVTFYEMSGGSEFDADALRMSRVDVQELPDTQQTPSRLAGVDTSDAEVSRVALNLTTLEAVVTPEAAPAPDVVTEAAVQTPNETYDVVLPSLIPAASPQTDDVILASTGVVVQEVDLSDDSAPVAGSAAADLRSVTGTRVNVRGGPGTDFSVVNSLTRGTRVEILEDPGDGWVMLRPVDGGPIGWMADFLLSDAG